ncbi:CAG pathogenicity island protein 12 family protein [Helicobacter pylori GAM96Ai]|uniref:cag pathogenicity island Cag12 family protein n=1 Tax=Helicobacter pylori TaxID=210 RepID=UPI0002BC5DA5|nr:cag pathogenicity island Cag12 family protein [Helicobacter pylori]EMH44213.1 CAG pathogenicity island protein 12 family protein [Helicobacter pylori GAM96Ai]
MNLLKRLDIAKTSAVIGAAILCVTLGACHNYAKKVVKQKNHSYSPVANELVEKYSEIPLNEKLKDTPYMIQVKLPSYKDYLIDNKQVALTFKLVHHAKKITLIGDANKILQYKNYFQANGARADVEFYLQPTLNQKNVVMIAYNYNDNSDNTKSSQTFDVLKGSQPMLGSNTMNLHGYDSSTANNKQVINEVARDKAQLEKISQYYQFLMKDKENELTTRKNNEREILETLSNRAGYQMRQNVISSEIFKNANLNMDSKEAIAKEKQLEEKENEYLRNQVRSLLSGK